MLDVMQLKQVFNDKLAKTGSMDDAFTKACWIAYQAGLKDAHLHSTVSHTTSAHALHVLKSIVVI
jgi:hypothetical protein